MFQKPRKKVKNNIFKNANVLITGGLGFIGSNLAIRLVGMGANVTLMDNMLPRQGGNLFNIETIKEKVHVNFSDIRNELSMNYLVQDKDYIFHLAGQVNHVDSMRNPIKDLDINCRGTLVLLEACNHNNPDARIIFAGTRGEYGKSVHLPVNEEHPTNPVGIYAITNLTAEKMVLVYHRVKGLKGICLRITNTFGPRHQMMHDEYGVLNWFIRKALDNEAIPVFGEGTILRDFLFIDDLIDALLQSAISTDAYGDVYNVGSGEGISFKDLAEKIIAIAGTGSLAFVPFTQERKEVEPGDYVADIRKIREATGWEPHISLDEGILKTVEFYRKYREHYWKK